MFEMFWAMVKEEWRTHSTMFGSAMFGLFPFLILMLSFVFSVGSPFFISFLGVTDFWLLFHYFFLLFGVIVGAFGLLGKEFMNRRFGQASLVAYSSRSLPVSEWLIFLNFFLKDLLYYFVLWILPIIGGFFLSGFFINFSINFSLLLFSVFLSFMLGLSSSFILSSIYSYSSKLLIFLVLVGGALLFLRGFNLDFLYFLPSYSLFINPSMNQVVYSVIIISLFSFISLFFLRVDYSSKTRFFKNWFTHFSNFFKDFFVSKDLLDLHRSEGGLGKILFSFLFPLLIVWVVLFFFLNIISVGNFFLLFCVLLGIISSSMYNWVTEFDVFTSYEFLPVKVSSVLKSKIITYWLLNIVSVFIVVFACFQSNNVNFLFHGLFAFIVSSAYTLATTLFLTGLYPNLLLYNPRVLFTYLFSSMPVPALLIITSLFNPDFLLLSPLLLIIPFFMIKWGLNKWDSWTEPVI